MQTKSNYLMDPIRQSGYGLVETPGISQNVDMLLGGSSLEAGTSSRHHSLALRHPSVFLGGGRLHSAESSAATIESPLLSKGNNEITVCRR
jgi:hypothetical protein